MDYLAISFHEHECDCCVENERHLSLLITLTTLGIVLHGLIVSQQLWGFTQVTGTEGIIK